MELMNEVVGEKNCLDKSGGKKELVLHFRRQHLWKCIGWILLEVTFAGKGHNIWGETPIYFGKKAQTKSQNMFVVTQVYIRHVVTYIVLISVMLSIELFYLRIFFIYWMLLCCFSCWFRPPVRDVCTTYEVVVFQPWTLTTPHPGSFT